MDPDYVDHRYDFLNAGHRWCEQKFHFREAQYAKWQMSESLPAGVAVLALPACYRHSAEIRVSLLPDRTALTRVKPADLRVGPWVDSGRSVTSDFRSTSTLGDADALRHCWAVPRAAARAIGPTPSSRSVGTGWADPMSCPRRRDGAHARGPIRRAVCLAARVLALHGRRPAAAVLGDTSRACGRRMGRVIAFTEEHPPAMCMEVPRVATGDLHAPIFQSLRSARRRSAGRIARIRAGALARRSYLSGPQTFLGAWQVLTAWAAGQPAVSAAPPVPPEPRLVPEGAIPVRGRGRDDGVGRDRAAG